MINTYILAYGQDTVEVDMETTKETGYPPTPELDKMGKVTQFSQCIGEFLEWLEEQGIHLGSYHKHEGSDDPDEPSGCWESHICRDSCSCSGPYPHDPAEMGRRCACRIKVSRRCGFRDDEMYPIHETKEKLLARFFEIDLDKVERERRAILAYISKKQP